mmetsp:Transcript_12337/g.23937  ORF Transcript_12337/g.23937 Transcript_12337/m.23937 type:complete len:130 (-) Transcript_12337:12-401(-)
MIVRRKLRKSAKAAGPEKQTRGWTRETGETRRREQRDASCASFALFGSRTGQGLANNLGTFGRTITRGEGGRCVALPLLKRKDRNDRDETGSFLDLSRTSVLSMLARSLVQSLLDQICLENGTDHTLSK